MKLVVVAADGDDDGYAGVLVVVVVVIVVAAVVVFGAPAASREYIIKIYEKGSFIFRLFQKKKTIFSAQRG